jgi:oxalate decarboxylase
MIPAHVIAGAAGSPSAGEAPGGSAGEESRDGQSRWLRRWGFFPAGLPHSLQGLGPVGAEFVIVFDDGSQSESNTLLLTDWFAHTPPDVLAKNFQVARQVFDDIPLHNLWIFPGEEPGDLEADQVAAGVEWGGTEPVIFRMSEVKPMYENSGGSIRIADSANFPASQTVAAALVVVKPGSMRELHWHPNADEWQYYMQGSARMTVFNTGPHANTTEHPRGNPRDVPARRPGNRPAAIAAHST